MWRGVAEDWEEVVLVDKDGRSLGDVSLYGNAGESAAAVELRDASGHVTQ
jgi:hypothetical protein